MDDDKIPDLSDPMVRAMADRNHTPEERWTVGGGLMAVTCETCGNSWPCPTRSALRALNDPTRLRSVQGEG